MIRTSYLLIILKHSSEQLKPAAPLLLVIFSIIVGPFISLVYHDARRDKL